DAGDREFAHGVMRFQSEHDLPADGEVDEKTRQAIAEDYGG
ncbi:MAG TPA: peptidoglycan-binding protein, partial [Planctomycetaceae bacterium]|nr:peptidoglycan-binding protein [Planctomycetaceae bacterium]